LSLRATSRNEPELALKSLQTNETDFGDLSEQAIVELAKSDPLAMSYLYRQHYASIHRYVNRRIGSVHDTNDIVSEVFMTMVRYLPRFRWTGAPFRCWLLVLTTTQINRWIRKRRFFSLWRSVHVLEPSADGSSDALDPRLEPVRQALIELPLAFQTALTLYYFEDLSVESIAEIMKCRPGTIKSRLSRGRELLRGKMIQTEGEGDAQRSSRELLKRIEV
jgi:RNA polymerase sigma-70 factor (ECF subfamily)